MLYQFYEIHINCLKNNITNTFIVCIHINMAKKKKNSKGLAMMW